MKNRVVLAAERKVRKGTQLNNQSGKKEKKKKRGRKMLAQSEKGSTSRQCKAREEDQTEKKK